MTVVSFKWLNDGKNTELSKMPLGGERELLRLRQNRSDYYAAVIQHKFIYLCEAVIAARKVIEKFGVQDAYESWTATMKSQFNDNKSLHFPEETFHEDLESWYEDFVLKRLGVESQEDAQKKLLELTIDAKNALDKINTAEIQEQTINESALTMYWRLRSSGAAQIKTPAGVKSIDWDLSKKEEALDLICEVLTEDDLKQLHKKINDTVDVRDFEPVSESDVRGKSNPLSDSSTDSAANSVASSETITATGTK